MSSIRNFTFFKYVQLKNLHDRLVPANEDEKLLKTAIEAQLAANENLNSSFEIISELIARQRIPEIIKLEIIDIFSNQANIHFQPIDEKSLDSVTPTPIAKTPLPSPISGAILSISPQSGSSYGSLMYMSPDASNPVTPDAKAMHYSVSDVIDSKTQNPPPPNTPLAPVVPVDNRSWFSRLFKCCDKEDNTVTVLSPTRP